jgi:hypothetical protein
MPDFTRVVSSADSALSGLGSPCRNQNATATPIPASRTNESSRIRGRRRDARPSWGTVFDETVWSAVGGLADEARLCISGPLPDGPIKLVPMDFLLFTSLFCSRLRLVFCEPDEPQLLRQIGISAPKVTGIPRVFCNPRNHLLPQCITIIMTFKRASYLFPRYEARVAS